MTEHDITNLEFLLSVPPAVLADWYVQMSSDDHNYAMALLKAKEAELNLRLAELSDDVTDVSAAADALKQFTTR